MPIVIEYYHENLENQMKKGFLKAVGKVDEINIHLLFKPRGDLIDKYYYTVML